MKIAIFTNNYLPNPYGVSTSIETFREEFEKLGPASTHGDDRSSTRGGHQVFIFAPEFPGYIDKNPNVFRYPALDISIKFRFPLAIPYSRRIDKILENLDLDIIHSQHPNLLGTVAMKWAKRKKIPLVFTWHTLYDHYAHFAKVVPEKLAADYMIRKAANFANKADAVVVPTDSIIPILRKWGVTNKNIFAVLTGVVEKDFENPDGKKIRDKFGIKDNEVLLLLVSRLTEEKNIEFLFEAVKDILKNNSQVKFLVSGDGYLVPKLKKWIKNENLESQIILSGTVEREELRNYFASGDIFVCGSKSETQGMTLTEAMYVGLPIVAVDASGTKSLVLNSGNGFLVKEDKREFSEAVLKLVNDKNLRQKFGETSKKIAKSQFTSEICARKMLEVYDSLTFSFRKKK